MPLALLSSSSSSLLLLLLLVIAVHADLDYGIRCILASSQESALERWIQCLPSLHPPDPSKDRVLDDDSSLLALPLDSLPCTTASPRASNVCDRQNLRDNLLGAGRAGLIDTHAAYLDMAADTNADAIGDTNSLVMNESSEFKASQVIDTIDARSPLPAANLDALDVVGAGEGIGENQLRECNHCLIGKDTGTATDGLDGADQGTISLDNPQVGSHLLIVKDAVVVGDAHGIVNADKGIAANLPEESSDVFIGEAEIEAIYEKRAMDCEVENVDKGVQGDAFPAALRLNVLSALLITLITNCWRKTNRNGSRRRRRSSNRLQRNLGAAYDLEKTALRPAAEIDQPKTFADNLRPGILGAPLGTAVGAVFAEVFLNKSCSCKPSVSADEIWMLLEIAMRESLTPMVGVGSLVEDFMASFQSTYKTICTVHQAFPCQVVTEMACACSSSEKGSSANAGKLFCKTDETFDPLNVRLSQQTNYAGNTEALKDDLQDFCKDMRQQCSHCGTCSSFGENGNKSSRLLFRNNRGFQSSIYTAMDVSEKAEKNNVLADCSQSGSPERNNNLIKRGECSTVESARPEDCTLLWNALLPASRSNVTLGKSMMLPAQGFSRSMSTEGTSSSHAFPHVQQAGCYQDVYTELADKMQDSLSLHGNGDENGHWGRNIASSSPAELSSEDKDTAVPDSQCDDEDNVIQEHSSILQPAGGLSDAVVLARQTHGPPQAGWQKAFLHVFEKSVQAQEQNNYFKSIELAHLLSQLTLGEKQLQLASVSNDLMKEHIDLSRSKASLKESTVLERRLNATHIQFSKTCADELVAGLFVMVLSLAYSVRRYSSTLLFDLVSTCQSSIKEPHRSSWLYIDWFYNSLDSLTGQLQAFVCHVTVAGRILIGLSIVAVVSYLLLRQTVTSSSQSMSAVIIIIVLGVVCGLAGKVSVDSLGGNGLHWLFMWEMLCTLHALANCFTPFVCKLVNGSPLSKKTKFQIPLWLRRFSFHFTIVLLLPILAGQLPFGSINTVIEDLLLVLNDIVSSTFFFCWHSMTHVI